MEDRLQDGAKIVTGCISASHPRSKNATQIGAMTDFADRQDERRDDKKA